MARKPTPTVEASRLDTLLDKSSAQEDKNLIKQCRQRFVDTVSAWYDIGKEATEDQKFWAGQQYDDAIARAARAKSNSPQIKVNMLQAMVQQVENALRQQNISLTVHATDEAGSEDKAQMLSGMFRHIEQISNAKQAYLWAAGTNGALVRGLGFMKLNTRWCNDKANPFDQEVIIEGVKDPTKIIPDFSAELPDFSDARYWYEFEELSKDEFTEKYGSSILATAQFADWKSLGSVVGRTWVRENGLTLAKYWYKEQTIRHFALFEDGTTGYLDEYGVSVNDKGETVVMDPDLYETFPTVVALQNAKFADSLDDPGAPSDQFPVIDAQTPPRRLADVIRKREVVEEKVCWILTNGVEILQRGEWADSEFPFVAVCGHDHTVDGKRQIYGIVRYAKDTQKMQNFMASSVVRRIGAASRVPWIAAMESVEEPEQRKWETSNVEDWAILKYKAFPNGVTQPVAPPQRGDQIEPAVQMMMQAMSAFGTMSKQALGIYDAVLGDTPGERQSGSAIQTLAQKGEQNNMHYGDNLVMSMKRLGTLILRLIPKIYDTPRAVRIINPDDTAEVVKINQYFTKDGEQVMFNMMSDENYDVVIDTGPSAATRKAEQANQILAFCATQPQLMPYVSDILALNLDWDTSGKLVERIIQVQTQQWPWMHANDAMKDVPPQARAIIGRLQSQLQQVNQHAQQLNAAYLQEKAENQAQTAAHQSKERIEQMKATTDVQLKKLDLIAQASKDQDAKQLAVLKTHLDHVQHHQILHAANMETPPPAPTPVPGNVPQAPGDHVRDTKGDIYQYQGGDKKSKASYRKV